MHIQELFFSIAVHRVCLYPVFLFCTPQHGTLSKLSVIYIIILCVFCAVRQLEQQIKSILDSIAVSDERKKELIRGDAVDKAEQLSKSSLSLA